MSSKAERAFRVSRIVMPIKINGQHVEADVRVRKPRRGVRRANRPVKE